MSIEHYRAAALDALFRVASFNRPWEIWRPQLAEITGEFSDPQKTLGLGEQLSEVFHSTNKGLRDQASVSAGGAGWECLVCWYLNVILSGTNAVAMRQAKALVPAVVNDALTVNYGNIQTNTESDIIVLTFPKHLDFSDASSDKGGRFSDLCRSNIEKIGVHVVQCKTNWNDNAQIPMLWDMIYSADGFRASGLSLGRNGVSITDFRNFTYSFVTVPTQKKPIKAGSIPVKRVQYLSGGNFWGMKTKSGVARGLQEYFNQNLSDSFDRPIDKSIERAMKGNIGWYAHPKCPRP